MKKEFKTQLTTALLSCPIVYIPHFHYRFVDETLEEILCPSEGHKIIDLSLTENVFEYDCGCKCVVDFSTKKINNDMADYSDVAKFLRHINRLKFPQPNIILLKNFYPYLANNEIQSLLISFAYQYEKGEIDKASTIIIVSPIDVIHLPKELNKFITVIEIKAPNQEEIMEILSHYQISNHYLANEDEIRMELCRTLQGLQLYEIQQILYSSLVRTNYSITARTNKFSLEEKKNIVRKSGIIEVVDPNESFDQIGGLDILKEDLKRKALIYTHLSEAQKNNVSLPKGVLIIGMPGCGKTMIAKSIAKEFKVSLLRLDVNRLMGKYVGESETNLRNALATAEAAHPCVLWIDEIEKAFAGSNGQNSDTLVMRLMGHFLTWMQERITPVFIVATANDVMRPEFMRKGRFDEVYFVDFPNIDERTEILRKTIGIYNQRTNDIFDFSEISDYSSIAKLLEGKYGGFSGAEIKSVVNMIIEKKFVEYIELKKKSAQKSSGVIRVKIHQEDFKDAIDIIKDSVMANQSSKENPITKQRDKTNIERILEMQEQYKFKRASKDV